MKKIFLYSLAIATIILASVTFGLKNGKISISLGPQTVSADIIGDCSTEYIKTPSDKIPNFGYNPTIKSIQSGDWDDKNTWDLVRVPLITDIVRIDASHKVTINNVNAVAKNIGIDGVLRFDPNISTKLTAGNILVCVPGTLEIGTQSSSIGSSRTAEIVIANQSLNTSFDPSQYGTGIISLGTVTMHGAVKNETFVRLAMEPKAGDTTLGLSRAVTGWQAGDKIIVPDTRQSGISRPTNGDNRELMTLQSVSADGKTLTLTSALQFDHLGSRDSQDNIDFLPHVANITRNVVIRSENPAGTRGHTLFTQQATIDLRYVQFQDMGRTRNDALNNTLFDANGNPTQIGTNQIGRYPVHTHHLYGPRTTPANGYQFTMLGIVASDNTKWGVAIHDSHFGLIKDSIVYHAGGAGFVAEDGSETKNVFEHNFVSYITVSGLRADGRGHADIAHEGIPFWFRGPNNYVRDNIANDSGRAHGYKYFQEMLGYVRIPNFKGASTAVAGEYTTTYAHSLPLLEFARNEAYGNTSGLSIWWLCSDGNDSVAGCPRSVVEDFKIWNWDDLGYYNYPSSGITFNKYKARGNANLVSSDDCNVGISFGDYMMRDVIIQNADIQGACIGVQWPLYGRGTHILENSYLQNATNISITSIGAPGSSPFGPNMPPRETSIIRNVKFAQLPGSTPGITQRNIQMNYGLHYGSANLVANDKIYVCNYNQVAGDHFQVYYKEQRPDFLMPLKEGNLDSCPSPTQKTNAQCWADHGKAIAGEVAPCLNETRALVFGYTCATSALASICGSTPTLNQAPSALAGNDQVVNMPDAANLDGTVSDDGLPAGSSLASTWSKVSGPGNVTFGNASLADTTASFSAAGTYVLRLTATDGSLSSSDDVSVIVGSGGGVPGSGLIGHWKFDETSGLRATDSSGNNNDGSLVGGASWSDGKVGGGLNLNGNGYVDMGTGSIFNLSNDLSLSLWIKSGQLYSSQSSHASFIARWYGTGYLLWAHNGDIKFGDNNSSRIAWSGGENAIEDNTWHLITVTRNGTTGKIYMDGAEKVSGTMGSITGSDSLLGGAYAGGIGLLQGKIDEFRIYNRSLSATEVLALYQNNPAPAPSPAPAPPPTNTTPTVSAGSDQTITLPASASLSGTASDDGLPNPPATLTKTWSKVSGPGTVTFSNSSSLTSTASFSTTGTYLLRLTATDSDLTTTDDVTITVKPPVPTVTFSASPTSVSAGSSSTLTWSSANAASVSINQGIGSVQTSGTKSVSPATTTTYTITADNESGNVTASAKVTVTAPLPPIDVIKPAISNVKITTTSGNAIITWTTSEPATEKVDYGINTAYGKTHSPSSHLSVSHTLRLVRLNPGTTYHFVVKSADATGNLETTSDLTFKTLAKLNRPRKVINIRATGGSVNLVWDEPDEYYAGIVILRSTTGPINAYDSSRVVANILAADNTNTYHDTDVDAGTTYYYSVFTYDDQGNYSEPAQAVFTTTGTNPNSGGTAGGNIPVVPAPTASAPSPAPIQTPTSSSTPTPSSTLSPSPVSTPTTTPTVATIPSFLFPSNLAIGSIKSPDVANLQQRLIDEKRLSIKKPTGYFGYLTREAVKSYQLAHNIFPAFGYFGPLTRAFANRGTVASPSPAPSPTSSLTKPAPTPTSTPTPIPTISKLTLKSINPSSIAFKGSSFVIIVTGTGFTKSSIVKFNQYFVPTTYSSSAQLTATIPIAVIKGEGTADITVISSATATETSNPLTFTVER